MFDRDDRDVMFDPVGDPVIAAACAVESFEVEAECLVDALWVAGERCI